MTTLPADHDVRLARALRSLDGLSVGDAFGQRFFGSQLAVESMIAQRAIPRSPWSYTDDTEMALALFGVLREHGAVDQDALASAFAHRWRCDPTRGYAGTAGDRGADTPRRPLARRGHRAITARPRGRNHPKSIAARRECT